MKSAEELLTKLLAAWRRSHHPRLGDAVDALSASLPAREPLEASKKKADLVAWRQVDAQGDPHDVPRLLVAARGGQQDDVTRQMRALAARDDPRFARGVLALLEKPPYAGVPSRPMLTALLDLFVAAKDKRAAEPARELASRYFAIVHSSTGALVVKGLEAAADKLDALKEPALTDAAAALCEEAEALAPPVVRPRKAAAPRLDELFALVAQHLDDDRPRRVLADALLEAGDGRGEFILAQLDGRPADLKNPDVVRWLQPLSLAGSVTCERGFPSAVAVYKKAVRADLDLWRTVTAVRELQKQSVTAVVRLLDAPHLCNLREVRPVSSDVLARLEPRPRAWRDLVLTSLDAPSPASVARFPELRALALTLRDAPPEGFFAPTPKLERLTLDHQAGRLPPTLLAPLTSLRTASLRGAARTLALPPALETLSLDGGFEQTDFSRCTKLSKLACDARALAHQPEVPSVRVLSLRTAGEQHGLAGLTGLRHLQLGYGSTLAPGLLRPLRQLLSLELSYAKGLTAAHLEGLESLVHLGGLWTDWDGLPPLPSLRSFDCMTPRTTAPLAELLARAPDLEVLSLHWNSSSDLYFHPPDFGADAGWERLATLLAPSKVRVLQFHDDATLAREPGGPWRLAWRRRAGTTLEGVQRIAAGPLAVMNAVSSATPRG